jgi:hypothetical protein
VVYIDEDYHMKPGESERRRKKKFLSEHRK